MIVAFGAFGRNTLLCVYSLRWARFEAIENEGYSSDRNARASEAGGIQ
jgi:hypothetical protein